MRKLLLLCLLALPISPALADDYTDTLKLFREAGPSAKFFSNSYGYAVFPTIGKGGLGVAAGHGKGRVYVGGGYVGDTSMTQITVGPQIGGQAYSQMIFFQNKAAFNEFTTGNFEFAAQATAVAITAGAGVQGGSGGAGISASGTPKHAKTLSDYHGGLAVFTIAKGGLMAEASIGGQKFGYTPKGR